MINIIVLVTIILCAVLIKFASKKQNKILRNIGILVICICLIYMTSNNFKDFLQGFMEGWRSVDYH